MKAKLLRPLVGEPPDSPEVQARVVFPEPPKQDGRGAWVWPAGTEIEHWQAFRLVQQGVAVAVDDECRQAANRTKQQLATAQHAYERLSKGIHPEDFDKYDRGEIAGYNPDGSYIPGPNAQTFDEDDDEEEDTVTE